MYHWPPLCRNDGVPMPISLRRLYAYHVHWPATYRLPTSPFEVPCPVLPPADVLPPEGADGAGAEGAGAAEPPVLCWPLLTWPLAVACSLMYCWL